MFFLLVATFITIKNTVIITSTIGSNVSDPNMEFASVTNVAITFLKSISSADYVSGTWLLM